MLNEMFLKQNPDRLALLCLLTVALNGTFVIEQPISSLIMHHPRMQCLHASFEARLIG